MTEAITIEIASSLKRAKYGQYPRRPWKKPSAPFWRRHLEKTFWTLAIMFIIAFQTIWLSPLIGFNRGFVILIWLSTPSFILIPAFFVDYYSDFRRYRKWIETYDENWKG